MPKKKRRKQHKGKLTPKQEQFCRFYLGESKFNGTDAARRAGYKAKSDHVFHVIAGENLRKPAVIAYIDQLLAENGYTNQAIIKCLTDIATFDVRSLLTIHEDGSVTFKGGFDELTKSPSISNIRLFDGKISEIKFADPQRSLETIAKLRGMLKENVEVDLKVDEMVSSILNGTISVEKLTELAKKLGSIAAGSGSQGETGD